MVYVVNNLSTHASKRTVHVSDSDDQHEAPLQTQRAHFARSQSPIGEQSDSEEGGSDHRSSSEEGSEGAEQTDDDDELEGMEKNPRALEKKFAEEVSIAAASAQLVQCSVLSAHPV